MLALPSAPGGLPFCILHSAFCICRAPVPQQPQGEFRKPVFVGASPIRGLQPSLSELRLGRPAFACRPSLGRPSGLWCSSSIPRCERDGPGANPGFLTNFDGPTQTTGACWTSLLRHGGAGGNRGLCSPIANSLRTPGTTRAEANVSARFVSRLISYFVTASPCLMRQNAPP